MRRWTLWGTCSFCRRESGQRGRARRSEQALAEEIQKASGENVELAYCDVEQGYTGQRASGLAAAHGTSGSKCSQARGGPGGGFVLSWRGGGW
jgi:hypothetical protein